MLENSFETHPEAYKYSYSVYDQSSFLYYGDSVIKSSEGSQQGHSEVPALFSDAIQDLTDNISRK